MSHCSIHKADIKAAKDGSSAFLIIQYTIRHRSVYFCLSERYLMQGMLLATETRSVDSFLDPGGLVRIELANLPNPGPPSIQLHFWKPIYKLRTGKDSIDRSSISKNKFQCALLFYFKQVCTVQQNQFYQNKQKSMPSNKNLWLSLENYTLRFDEKIMISRILQILKLQWHF